MCRNIKPLFNFEPPTSEDEIRAAALQFVRKVSGSTHPSRANEEIFHQAVDDVTRVVQHLLDNMVTLAPPRDRAEFAARAKERSLKRFAPRG